MEEPVKSVVGAADRPLSPTVKRPPHVGGFLASASPLTPSSVEPARHVAGLAPLPLRCGDIFVSALIDLFMLHYSGRDSSRVQRLSWWQAQLPEIRLDELSDDYVHAALERLAHQSSRYYAGHDVNGQRIFKSKKKPIAAATLNRYAAALAAVVTWAIKKRIAPKGYVHPCRSLERRPENNEKTRFLSDEERTRLLEACRSARWPRLYLLVLMGLTTGARKGELLALRWQDVDLTRNVADCGRSKNGDPKSLPLVPAVVHQLREFAGKPSELVFPSARHPAQPFAFELQWAGVLHRARIRNFRFHDLRHSCASMLAREGATLLEIADVLGHRQLQMTRRYAHLTTEHKAQLVNRVLGQIG